MVEEPKGIEEGTRVAAKPRELLPDSGQRSSGGEERMPAGRRRSAYATRDLTTGSIPRNLWFLGWPQIAEGWLRVRVFAEGRGSGRTFARIRD